MTNFGSWICNRTNENIIQTSDGGQNFKTMPSILVSTWSRYDFGTLSSFLTRITGQRWFPFTKMLCGALMCPLMLALTSPRTNRGVAGVDVSTCWQGTIVWQKDFKLPKYNLLVVTMHSCYHSGRVNHGCSSQWCNVKTNWTSALID